ncbi:zinc-binding dehydrogenase [Amycolatopsis sp. NPDC004368]
MFSGRAWRVVKFGDPDEAVAVQEMTLPEPAAGRILVRVKTAGAGFPDLMMVRGEYPLTGAPPFGLGEEVTGEVVGAPPGSRFAVGDRVAGITDFRSGWGGFAEYTYIREESTFRVPNGMSDEEAGGFPIAFRTAYATLVERAPVEAGQALVVLGAAGSSGAAAVQLGKVLGATVIAVVGSPEKAEFVAGLGADHVLNHRTDDLPAKILELTGGRGADLIFDPVGGETAAAVLKSLGRNGRIAMMGLASGAPVPLDPVDMLMRNYTAVGVLALPQDDLNVEASVWDHLRKLVEDGAITTAVGTVYGFDDVPRMIAEQSSPRAGKSIVRVAL